MQNKKRLIPLQKRIVYAGDVFNSLMAEKGWSATEASDFMKVFRMVDAVEVVRCNDCKHYWKNVNTPGYSCKCTMVNDDDFCSHGERKDK